MKLGSKSIKNNDWILEKYAFGKFDPVDHVTLSQNINPHFEWSELPKNTASLVLICHDTDVPSSPNDVNVEGKTIAKNLSRIDFFHWVLIEIDPTLKAIEEGEFSNGITPRGKKGPQGPKGTRQGLNNYTQWFEGDKNTQGLYFGYDGPCPPWNDEQIHHYHFTLYATDLKKLPVEGNFSGPQVLEALKGHTLDKAVITGLYTLNKTLR